jgi:AcrR family transcriptional regulator
MGRPSREAEILAGALGAFAARGYDATRVRDIATRAGVSEAALYCHYRSKEDVALALFRTHMTRVAGALQEAAQGVGGESVEARLRALVARSLEAFATEPDAYAFVIAHQARFIGALPSDFPYPIRIVEALVREGQDEGSVREGPVRLLASLVTGCMTQPVRTRLEAPAGTIEIASREAVDSIARGAWAAIAASSG